MKHSHPLWYDYETEDSSTIKSGINWLKLGVAGTIIAWLLYAVSGLF